MARKNINSVVIVGRLVSDATVKTFQNGGGIINFTIASNETKKVNDNYEEYANFIDCSYSSKGAESFSQYLKKGQVVACNGSLHQDRWEKDGNKQSRIVVRCTDVELLGSKGDGTKTNSVDNEGFKEDIPF